LTARGTVRIGSMMTIPSQLTHLLDWLAANFDALLLGFAVAAILVSAMLMLRGLGRTIVRRDPDCKSWQSILGRVLSRTTIAFMVAAAAALVAHYANPPPRIERLFDIAFTIAFALQAAAWGRELILGLLGTRLGSGASEGAIGNAFGVIRVLVSVVLFGIALVVILDNLGVNVTALVAGLGIGGIAVGLAAQGIFSDLFAALAILLDRPFRRGDTIRFDSTTGTVERIGLKTTRLRSLGGEIVIMANTKLLEREIHNLAEGEDRRMTATFSLVYHTPPERLAQVEQIAKVAVEGQSGCRLQRCVLTTLAPSGLEHEMVFVHEGLDADAILAKRAAILRALLAGLDEAGLQIAYPTQTTFTAAPDGTLVMPYAMSPSPSPCPPAPPR
jgi:small-conductance mechanosensitive channel